MKFARYLHFSWIGEETWRVCLFVCWLSASPAARTHARACRKCKASSTALLEALAESLCRPTDAVVACCAVVGGEREEKCGGVCVCVFFFFFYLYYKKINITKKKKK